MSSVPSEVSKYMGSAVKLADIWGSILYNVKAYGAKGDNSTDDTSEISSAITAAAVVGGIVFCPPGVYIAGNLTVPSNVTLWFANGAKLSINNGATVTINGPIEAGLYQIFSGVGTVSGNIKNEHLYPQWWGAIANLSVDCSAAINAAITCAQSAGQYLSTIVLLPPGHYLVNSSIIIPHGTEVNRVTLSGYNATLRPGTAGMDVIKVVAQGSPASFLNIGETKILGFRIECAGVASRAIVIGRNGATYPYGVDGVFKSLIRDVDIRDFNTVGIEIADSRLWVIDDCTISTSVAGANPVYFNSTNDKNMSDHWLSRVQMAVPGNNTANFCVKMRVTSVSGTSGLGGIHFTDCVFYGQGIDCQATNANAGFADIFLTSCAVDGLSGTTPGYYGFYFKAFSANSSKDVFIVNTWVNAQGIGIYFEKVIASQIMGGKISSVYYQAISILDSSDNTVQGVKMYDVNTSNNGGGALNLIGTGNRNKVIGNNIFNATGHSAVIILIASTQVKPIVTHNTTDAGTAVTNNVAGTEGTNFIVAGNL